MIDSITPSIEARHFQDLVNITTTTRPRTPRLPTKMRPPSTISADPAAGALGADDLQRVN